MTKKKSHAAKSPDSLPKRKAGQSARLNLALQGGGSHGAFTWGVLDRLLDEDNLEIHAISGTSAGAINAAVLVSGYAKGGRKGAKAALEAFWIDVSTAGMMTLPTLSTPLDALNHNYNLENTPGYSVFDYLTRTFSPYQLNPLNLNPLKTILARHVDEKALRKEHGMHLFIAATAVRTGQSRVFHCHEVTTDALLASACIPSLFQAVEIDGEPYWDGGYMGNPVLWPLIYHTHADDILLVQINPLYREEIPKTAFEIINRLNEISFNSALIGEMRAINFVSKLVHENRLDNDKYRDVRMHMVAADFDVKHLDASSKMNPRWDFLLYLRQHGYEQANQWLKEHKAAIGRRGTLDIKNVFLKSHKSAENPPEKKRKAS